MNRYDFPEFSPDRWRLPRCWEITPQVSLGINRWADAPLHTKALWLGGDLPSEDLPELSRFHQLEYLDLGSLKADDRDFDWISRAPSLKRLALPVNGTVTDEILARAILGLPLEGLCICINHFLTDGLADLLLTFPSLTEVCFHWVTSFESVGARKLVRAGRMEHLTLIGSEDLGDGFADDVRACVGLQTLRIGEFSHVSDVGAAMIASLPSLKTFEWTGPSGLSDAGLRALQQCRTLRWMRLGGHNRISTSAVIEFIDACPSVELFIDGCPNVDHAKVRQFLSAKSGGRTRDGWFGLIVRRVQS